MSDRISYTPGPASRPQVLKGEEQWTLILVRELRHAPEKVWLALTDPVHLREWAPFDADGRLDTAGATVKLTWVATGNVTESRVTRVEPPWVLEFSNTRWQLEAVAGGTRLTLWHGIPPRFIAWGAAGWHICFDVLDRLLADRPIGRIAGADAMHQADWHRLVAEYAELIGVEPPKWPAKAASKS